MLNSMTGYGKAEVITPNSKYIVEIKSLNGKNADISIKSQILPRDKELLVRKMISEALGRGNIDLYINEETSGETAIKKINLDVLSSYYEQLKEVKNNKKYENLLQVIDLQSDRLMESMFRFPDVFDSKKEDITEESVELLIQGVKDAIKAIQEFRIKEGEILKKDVCSRVDFIYNTVSEVEKYEAERIQAVRDRILSRIAELELKPDENRLEQEIIFYIEKLDINEEKVRLRQHCNYFIETINNEPMPGKKLGFIAQEMGREINTMGSKANHAEIQKWVVRMKDELEKIKEQSLNIL